MKDHVESYHLTKFDAFGINRNEVIDLETWLKSLQMSVMLRQRPKTILNSYIFFSDFCDSLKNWQAYVFFISTSFKW